MTSTFAAAKTRRATGAMFFAFFGSAWLVWWCLESFGVSLPVLSIIGVAGLIIGLTALRQFHQNRWALLAEASNPQTKKRRQAFKLMNAAQWASIFIAALILANTGHPEWIRVAIILIVGTHFLPLAMVFGYRWHYASGGALILLAASYPFLTKTGPLDPVGLLGTGMILWASALVALSPLSLLGSQAGTPSEDR